MWERCLQFNYLFNRLQELELTAKTISNYFNFFTSPNLKQEQ